MLFWKQTLNKISEIYYFWIFWLFWFICFNLITALLSLSLMKGLKFYIVMEEFWMQFDIFYLISYRNLICSGSFKWNHEKMIVLYRSTNSLNFENIFLRLSCSMLFLLKHTYKVFLKKHVDNLENVSVFLLIRLLKFLIDLLCMLINIKGSKHFSSWSFTSFWNTKSISWITMAHLSSLN